MLKTTTEQIWSEKEEKQKIDFPTNSSTLSNEQAHSHTRALSLSIVHTNTNTFFHNAHTHPDN